MTSLRFGERAFHRCRKVEFESRAEEGVTERLDETVDDRYGKRGVFWRKGKGDEFWWIWRE